jgi:hypothetical protein
MAGVAQADQHVGGVHAEGSDTRGKGVAYLAPTPFVNGVFGENRVVQVKEYCLGQS